MASLLHKNVTCWNGIQLSTARDLNPHEEYEIHVIQIKIMTSDLVILSACDKHLGNHQNEARPPREH